MNTHIKTIALFICASAALTTYGQAIPLTAKVHQTEQVFMNGQLVRTHTRDGIFLRTSTGVILKQWTLIDGKRPTGEPGYGVLSDTQKGVIYSVDYVRQAAYLHPSFATSQNQKPQQSTKNPESNAPERGSFEGLSCTYKAVYVHANGATTNAGRDCRSDAYGIDLSQEVTFPAPMYPAPYSKVSEQLTDIQIGAEPDQKLFDLQGFTVYRPDEKK
jgi:hypothetical protein